MNNILVLVNNGKTGRRVAERLQGFKKPTDFSTFIQKAIL